MLILQHLDSTCISNLVFQFLSGRLLDTNPSEALSAIACPILPNPTMPTVFQKNCKENTHCNLLELREKKNEENARMQKQTNLSGQLVVTALPLAAPDKAIALADPPEERQHQANSEVRDLVAQHVSHVGHANPLLSALLLVNLIHSRAEDRHYLQLWQRLDQCRVRAGGRV